MEIKGLVKVVNATEEVGAKGFKKRLVVVETQETYPQLIPIEFVQDKCSLLDGLQIGQDVTVHINLRGSEYNGRYYVQLQGWKIDATINPVSNMQPPLPSVTPEEEKDDLLPF
jgi:formylmethanofuran dehydrogenase subunit A